VALGTAVHPASGNVFVKDHAATGNLVVDFSRNPSKFAINKYIQIRTVEKEAGYFLRFTVEEAGRILSSGIDEMVWPDGQERPLRNEGTEQFLFGDYKTQRYDYGFNMGDKTVKQAGWDIVGQHSRIKAQQAMTGRTQLVKTILDTIGDGSGGGDTTHTSAVASITGNSGNWGQSTTQRQDIKRSLNHAAELILKDTLGAAEESSLILVVSPNVAIQMSECQEIVDHVKHSDHAVAQIRGDQQFGNPNARFGLPLQLYGFDVVVDATYKTTSKKGASSTAKSAVLGTNVGYMVSRPGDLVATSGGPSFSTIMIFAYEEMTVETLKDSRNRRTEGHVVDDIDVVATAPVTGFRFTSAV
jgi:hypothetical protein